MHKGSYSVLSPPYSLLMRDGVELVGEAHARTVEGWGWSSFRWDGKKLHLNQRPHLSIQNDGEKCEISGHKSY